MKKCTFFIILLTVFLAISCEEEGLYTKKKEDKNLESSILLKKGTFVVTPNEPLSGGVEIRQENNNRYVNLTSFSASGPDLKVYLSKSSSPDNFVNLGSLVKDKFVYQIPENINIDEYPFVIIYCQQYSVIFGYANLK